MVPLNIEKPTPEWSYSLFIAFILIYFFLCSLWNDQVAWVRVDTQTILTIHMKTISRNPRIGLSHNSHRHWYLRLRDVEAEDRGWYMCKSPLEPFI